MPRYISVFSGVLLLILSGCSSVRVSQDFRPETDFAGFGAYRWEQTTTDPNDPLTDERIRNAIDRNLSTMGLTAENGSGTAAPDLLVSYRYTIRPVIESTGTGTDVGFGGFWGGGLFGGFGVGTGRDVRTRYEGVLNIYMKDARNGWTVWQGKGTHMVEEHWEPAKRTERINELVDKVMAQFPPKQSGAGD